MPQKSNRIVFISIPSDETILIQFIIGFIDGRQRAVKICRNFVGTDFCVASSALNVIQYFFIHSINLSRHPADTPNENVKIKFVKLRPELQNNYSLNKGIPRKAELLEIYFIISFSLRSFSHTSFPRVIFATKKNTWGNSFRKFDWEMSFNLF